MTLIRERGVVTICTVALAVVFAAAMVGCSQQRGSEPCGKHAACSGDCHAKCAKAGDKPCGKACPKGCTKPCCAKAGAKPCGKACPQGCTKPCCAKAAGKPINETCPISGKPVAEGITVTTPCGKTVGFCCKDCIEKWKELSREEQCKRLGCKCARKDAA